MIVLKKPTATQCSDVCTLSLILHTAKIATKIHRRRTERKIEDIIGEDLFGFRRRRKRARDAIGMLRITLRLNFDVDKKLWP
jgi:hypothetical protein